jgi:antitoxin component YwqK of YwqJK toxin-antitoxin module
MKQLVYSFILILFLSACNKTKEIVEQKHEDGSPKVVSTYKNDRITHQVEFYTNGQQKIKGSFDDLGKREGHWEYWYENGNQWSECDYKSDIKHGINATYYENGQKRFSGEYKEDKKVGKWTFWKEDGTIATEKEM